MSKYVILPIKFFVWLTLSVMLSMSMLLGASAAKSEDNQLNSGRRNGIVEPGQYRVTVPGRSAVFRTDADRPWVFRFNGLDGKTRESVLIGKISPAAKDMEAFYGDWAATTEKLYRKAYAEYGELIKSISFERISSDAASDTYVMYMELGNESGRLELTTCWRFEQSYCIEFWGFNSGDIPEMNLLTKQAAKSFKDLTQAPAPASDSGYFTTNKIFKRLGDEIYWFFPEESDEVMSLRKSGNVHFYNGEFEKAIKDYNAAIRLDPENAALYHQRAVMYNDADMLKEALSNYDKAIKLESDCPLYYAERALCYQALGETEKALADIDKAMELDPDNYYYFSVRSLCYLEMGKYQKAINESNNSINRNPYYPVNYHRRGVSYFYLGKYEKALETFTKAAELEPERAAHHDWLGSTLKDLGRYREAIVEYDQAIGLEPDISEFHHHRAASYFYLHEYEKALEGFTKAIELAPDSPESHGSLAATLNNLERYQEAVNECNKAIKLEKKREPAPNKFNLSLYYHDRGLAYYGLYEDDKALSDFAKAIKLSPTVHYFYSNRAMVYARQGKYDEAIAESTVALGYAEDSVVYANRGVYYIYTDQYEEAVSDFTKAIKLDPRNAAYYRNRAMAYYYLEEYEKAEADELKAQSLK